LNYPHPLLAREGWPFIGGALVLAIVTWWFAGFAWSLPLLVLAIFVIQFFRDPPREVPTLPLAVLSPADGRVVKVAQTNDPNIANEALLISVFMNVFNVHSNRSRWTASWVRGMAGSIVPTSTGFVRQRAQCDGAARWGDIVGRAVAGLITRHLCYVRPATGWRADALRLHSLRLASTSMPATARPQVAVGDIVHDLDRAGEL
jgi:phosphatidylserine decarboxylase